MRGEGSLRDGNRAVFNPDKEVPEVGSELGQGSEGAPGRKGTTHRPNGNDNKNRAASHRRSSPCVVPIHANVTFPSSVSHNTVPT